MVIFVCLINVTNQVNHEIVIFCAIEILDIIISVLFMLCHIYQQQFGMQNLNVLFHILGEDLQGMQIHDITIPLDI